MSGELNYPNLTNCKVILRGDGGMDQPPVRLPPSCKQAAENTQLPPLYDFATELKVLEDQKERQAATEGGDSPEQVKKSVLSKMKSVTKADDGVCIAILEENQYNLKTSIETYFAA
mmetsp:Transcript_23606/g.51151  ORF Transcript_23606/g.51151 Transcript_23606/m.51151 type:complete len:116 (+) Transcript_23606:92-439(+)|eukprot:CAMPEP_0168739732 /NCGR_PEP_ID=MMETSP0724-20121128/11615_1 /TAXON_ID=265536 /ORGANISM="Amphiprora sp., Strain CCMP467" /LENGTH=115 /DNA_ID=CAMNT_0008787145 /DNA_START=30 /DNA_END=377 /DNA_ORIENTATION=-